MKRHPFNLIELMLAMGVIVIGLVSVMALFPIGANANRDAAAGNYAAQTAEQTLNLLSRYVTSSQSLWYDIIDNQDTSGTAKPHLLPLVTNDTEKKAVQDLADGYIPDDTNRKKSDFDIASGTGSDRKTICQLNPGSYNEALLIISEYEDSASNWVSDFEAMAVIWQEQIDLTGTGNPVPLKYGTRLCIEVSWPAQLPYARRQKASYRLDVFNPHAND
jgi:type II secretory pathway pseudopilin PulG